MQKKVILILSGITFSLVSFIFIQFGGAQNTEAQDLKNFNAATPQRLADIQRRLSALENTLDSEITRIVELESLLNDIDNKLFNTTNIKPKAEQSIIKATDMVTLYKQVKESGKKNIRYDRTAQISRFIEAGFSEDDALWLVEKIEDIRIDGLYASWERAHQNYLKQGRRRKTGIEEIKERLGPEGYERYFKAQGSSASVVVEGVIDDSPAALAGLQPGDEIISYNGERICYNLELTQTIVRGELGEPVIIEILRDGNTLQIPMERGPLGITMDWGGVVLTPAEQIEGQK